MSRFFYIAALALVIGTTARLHAQADPYKLDLAVSFAAETSLKSSTSQDFWLYGGSIELGSNVYKGFGIAANITGTHAASIGNSAIPVSLVSETFGPRYRWHAGHKFSIFGEALVGEANGFYSLFPYVDGAKSDASSLAVDVGGGVDYTLSKHFAVRMIQVSWTHTDLPNATDNVQNNVRVGAGIVFRFAH